MPTNAFDCPNSHVWIITCTNALNLCLTCKFCGSMVHVLRFGGIKPTVQLHAIMADPESRRDPVHFPPKTIAVKLLNKEASDVDDKDPNPFAD